MFALISSRSGSQSAMILRWALQGHHGPLVFVFFLCVCVGGGGGGGRGMLGRGEGESSEGEYEKYHQFVIKNIISVFVEFLNAEHAG